MNLIEYFDVQNMEHLKAYQHLQNNGYWSKDFYDKLIELNIEIPLNWNIILSAKLADAYINLKLGS